MAIKQDFLTITNVLLMPEMISEEKVSQSPFQGFLTELFNQEYFDLVDKFCILPRHALELFVKPEDLITLRHQTGSNIILLSVNLFLEHVNRFITPLTTVSFHPSHEKYIESIKIKAAFKPIFIGTGNKADIKIEDIENSFSIDQILYEKLKSFAQSNEFVSNLINEGELRQKIDRSNLDFKKRYHGVTIPNELLYESLGFDFEEYEPLKPDVNPDASYRSIKILVDSLVQRLSNAENISITKSSLIVYSTAMFSYLYNVNHHYWNQILRATKEKAVREAIKNGLVRNQFYSGFSMKFDGHPKKILEDKLFQGISFIRKAELKLTNFGITLLTLENNCPAVRLPNAVNQQITKLRHIEELSKRDDKKGEFLLQKEVNKLSDLIISSIPPELVSYLEEPPTDMKLCLDFPLEWVRFNKIPLMFQTEVSRLAVTPGNIFLQHASISTQMIFTEEKLRDILVIRSFNETDPLKYHLERAIEHYADANKDQSLNVKIVDVQTRDELIRSVNSYEGIIVVFDCHGNHGGLEDSGWFCIGEEKVDTWTLAAIARIPPIVILSACLTHPIGGSHASIANGLLRSGALTVIGTFLPVNSVKSSIFVARILFRINSFLPAIKKLNITSVTWRTLISDFLKMSYTTDILRHFLDVKNLITLEDYKEIHIDTNTSINYKKLDWFQSLISQISLKSKIKVNDIETIVREELALTETMYYVQLGSPENIVIDLTDE